MSEWLRAGALILVALYFSGFESQQRRKLRNFWKCIKHFQNLAKKHSEIQRKCQGIKTGGLEDVKGTFFATFGYCHVSWTFTPLRLLVPRVKSTLFSIALWVAYHNFNWASVKGWPQVSQFLSEFCSFYFDGSDNVFLGKFRSGRLTK